MAGWSFSKIKQTLREVKPVDEFCPIHPDQQMIKYQDKPAFCPLCAAENKRQRDNDIMLKSVYRDYRRDFHGVLYNDSILDDPELMTASFDTYEAAAASESANNAHLAKQIAYQYLDRNRKFNTIITGAPGRGKSHLALSMLKAVNEHIKPDASCLFISVNQMFRLIKDSFNNKQSRYTEAYMIDLVGRANLLVLDDLGSEASFRRDNTEASEYVQQTLYGILNQRNRTIITTNLSSEELTRIYNPKLLSRMYKGIDTSKSGVDRHVISFTAATTDHRKVVF